MLERQKAQHPKPKVEKDEETHIDIIIGLILFAFEAFAIIVYCTLEFRQVLDKSLVILNFGKTLTPLTDKGAKQIEFANRVEVLNYMAKEGWVIEPVTSLDGVHQILLMSKEVKNEQEIKERFPMLKVIRNE